MTCAADQGNTDQGRDRPKQQKVARRTRGKSGNQTASRVANLHAQCQECRPTTNCNHAETRTFPAHKPRNCIIVSRLGDLMIQNAATTFTSTARCDRITVRTIHRPFNSHAHSNVIRVTRKGLIALRISQYLHLQMLDFAQRYQADRHLPIHCHEPDQARRCP